MKTDEYKTHLLEHKKQVTESRTKWMKIATDCWQIYRNEQDYSSKEDWQAQICIPDGQSAVRKAQGIIRSSMTKPKDFFNIEHGTNPDHVKLRMMELFRRQDVQFLPKFCEGVGVSLVFGIGCIKHTFKTVKKQFVEAVPKMGEMPLEAMKSQQPMQPQQAPQQKMIINKVTKEVAIPYYEVRDPRTTFFLLDDPDNFVIEEDMFDLSEVLSWQDNDNYDSTAINKLAKSDYSSNLTRETEKRMNEIGIKQIPNKYRKKVLVQTFYGDVIDEKGKIINKDCIYRIANQEWLIMKPLKFPWWHGRKPHVFWSPLSVVLRKTGQSILEGMRTIQRAMNNITNLQLDALIYELLGIPEVDTGKILNPADVISLTPGRPIRRMPNAPIGPAITIDRPNPPSSYGLHLYERLRRDAQSSTFVTDVLMGLASSGEAPTATEITRKGGESYQHFQVISMDIEDNALVPLLEMTASNILQFDDFLDISDAQLMPYKSMARAERVAALQGPYTFTARGITSFFEMQETLGKIAEVLGFVAKIPYSQMAIKWSAFLNLIFDNSMIPDAKTLIHTQEEIDGMVQQQQDAQNQAQQQQMSMQQQDKEADRQNKLILNKLEGMNQMMLAQEKGNQQMKREALKAALTPVGGGRR